MPEMGHGTTAADLLVHGTYELRRGISRLERRSAAPLRPGQWGSAGARSDQVLPETGAGAAGPRG